MKTIGIISEYNPLHEGHIYHINEIRKEFGNESAIIALMSGNYVQRGDVSIGDKYFRAKMAIDNGIDLVLEFPFPFCCENATIFANKAIEILTKLKIVDVISFGSECGDITLLKNIAEKINNRINEFDILLSTKHSSNGFPHDFFEKTKEFLSNEEYCAFLEPNNFLGIQYIIAAMKQGSNFEWHTTKRINGNHNQIEDTTGTLFSSSYLRKLFFEDATRLKDSLPDTLYIPYINQLETGYFSASFENVYPLIKWNLKHQKYDSKIGNCGGGLIQLIQKNILKAHSFSELVDLSSNKKYTKSRVRRAIRDYLFGISYETLSISPNFSFVLGISETGQNVLKMIKYNTAFPCIVKPSDAKTIVGPNNVLLNLQTKADEFYTLTTLKPLPLDYFMKCKPYIKK